MAPDELAADPRIGMWGTFDLENYGDLLFPRIAEAELLRRLPDALFRPYSPYGFHHPIRLDAGRGAEPLGIRSDERLRELAGALDVVVVGGGEIIHTKDELLAPHYGVDSRELLGNPPSRFFIEGLGPELERACPALWHAVGIPFEPTEDEARRFRAALADRSYVSVRGETSRHRLEAAGLEREVVVVPDSAFLLTRLFPTDLLERRVERLRDLGWYPREQGALVVQGNRAMLQLVPAIAAAVRAVLERRRDLRVVLVGIGPCHGDHELADALSDSLSEPFHRLPNGVSVEDLAAALWGAEAFVGSSMHATITAFCFDKPHVVLDALEFSKLDDLGRTLENPDCVVRDVAVMPQALERAEYVDNRQAVLRTIQGRIDEHFDRIAQVAAESAHARRSVSGPTSAASVHEAAERRLVEERFAFTDALAVARAHEFEVRARADELQRRLDSLQTSRSLRLTAPLRSLADRLRRSRTRRVAQDGASDRAR